MHHFINQHPLKRAIWCTCILSALHVHIARFARAYCALIARAYYALIARARCTLCTCTLHALHVHVARFARAHYTCLLRGFLYPCPTFILVPITESSVPSTVTSVFTPCNYLGSSQFIDTYDMNRLCPRLIQYLATNWAVRNSYGIDGLTGYPPYICCVCNNYYSLEYIGFMQVVYYNFA